MITGISNIKEIAQDKIQITFCVYPDCENFMTIIIDARTAWEIVDFCRTKLSYGAKRENQIS